MAWVIIVLVAISIGASYGYFVEGRRSYNNPSVMAKDVAFSTGIAAVLASLLAYTFIEAWRAGEPQKDKVTVTSEPLRPALSGKYVALLEEEFIVVTNDNDGAIKRIKLEEHKTDLVFGTPARLETLHIYDFANKWWSFDTKEAIAYRIVIPIDGIYSVAP